MVNFLRTQTIDRERLQTVAKQRSEEETGEDKPSKIHQEGAKSKKEGKEKRQGRG